MKTKRKRGRNGKPATKRTPARKKHISSVPYQGTERIETSLDDEQDVIEDEVDCLDYLTEAERIFLEDWFAGRSLHGEDSERAREVILEELTGGGIYSWSPSSRFEEDDVLAADILGLRFEGLPILEVHGSWMCAGGLSFDLCHVDFLNRQALCYTDSFVDTNCAVRLPAFYTRADLEAMIYKIIDSRYDYDSSPWDRSTSTLVSNKKLTAWRNRICGPPKKDDDY